MIFPIKKIFLNVVFNSCIFIILIIGIQNSSNKSKVKFLKNETVDLPISFIVGGSFICGSLFSIFFPPFFKKE